MKKSSQKSPELVLGFLEKVSSKVFSGYSEEITSLVDNKHGVYALYKRDRLYYVGLATNLKRRVKHHLQDRHKGKWDSFSLYLVRKSDHIKELESLILRIADPKGNRVKGNLPSAENMMRRLDRRIKSSQDTERHSVLNITRSVRKKKRVRKPKSSKSARTERVPALAPYTTKRFMLRADYKKKPYKAFVLADGSVNYADQSFNSPSTAASAVTGRPMNGWRFWKYKNPAGEWVKLDARRSHSVRRGEHESRQKPAR